MNRLRALAVCALLGIALAAQGRLHAQQTIRDVVYDDSLLTSKHWFTSLWACNGGPVVDPASTAQQYNGQYSIAIHHSCPGGWGAVVLNRRTRYWEAIWMDPADYQALVFWFNPGASTTGDSALAVFTDNNGPQVYLRNYLTAALTPNTWTRIAIPLADLRPNGGQFCTLHFWNMSNHQTQYYLDAISFDRSVADAEPPVITALSVTDRSYSAITLALQTDEPARYTVSYTSGGTTQQKSTQTFSTSHTIILDGLMAGMDVTYSVTVTDTTGNVQTRHNETASTPALPAPNLVSPADGATETTPVVRLVWTAREQAQSYTLQIATVPDFATLIREIPDVTDTTFAVEGLPNAMYYWRVRTSTPYGFSSFSTGRSFTKNVTQQTFTDVIYDDAVAPAWRTGIWDCSGGGIMLNPSVTTPHATGQYSFGITHSCPGGWGAFGLDRRNADWTVIEYMYPNEYRILGLSFNPGSDTAAANNLHVMLDNGSDPRALRDFIPTLRPNQWHTIRIPIAEINSSGSPFFRIYFFNMGSGSPVYYLDDMYLEYIVDTTPPAISGLAVDSITADGAVLHWSTDERAVYSVVVTGGSDTIRLSSTDYAQNFRAPLFDRLQPSVTYTYTLTVTDFQRTGSTPNSTTATGTFTTAEPDTTAPLLTGHSVQTTGPAHAVLQITTDEPARLTIQYGTNGYSLAAVDTSLNASRLFEVQGLTPETTYRYRLVVTDKFGNSRTIEQEPPFTWTTTAMPVVPVFVNTEEDNRSISPYVYGSNANNDEGGLNLAARRLGGNRLTAYNWENNFSHAGSDYMYQNDDFLPWYRGIPRALWLEPGIVQTAFHDTSLAQNAYTLLTLQAADYVAADGAGPVQPSQAAPSTRWKQVRFAKNAPFSLTPDTTDNYVYMDEQVHFLTQRYGGANTTTGIRGYSVDNEPDLWFDTHSRIHPGHVSYGELFDKTIRLAQAVKNVDPNAEIFGPASYGFNGYITLQDAPDRSTYNSRYGTFLNAYLDTLRRMEQSTGRRLLDVLDLHWYPEARGANDRGQQIRITDTATAPGVAHARMQAPRTLWDKSYRENSWVRGYFGANDWALLPWLHDSIGVYYPGTKLAITEYSYGAPHHISGGIAQADVLGVFGKYGVYMAHSWYPAEQYTAAGHRIYRNYDGNNATYGDINVQALWTDTENVSVYAAGNSADTTVLHLILINKHQTSPQKAQVSVSAPRQYTYGEAWAFDRTSPVITQRAPVEPITDNSFTYELPPLSVYHLVLHSAPGSGGQTMVTDVPGDRTDAPAISIAPNPVQGLARITVNVHGTGSARLLLVDAPGRLVATLADGLHAGTHMVTLDSRALQLSPGVYFCVVEAQGVRRMQPVVVIP